MDKSINSHKEDQINKFNNLIKEIKIHLMLSTESFLPNTINLMMKNRDELELVNLLTKLNKSRMSNRPILMATSGLVKFHKISKVIIITMVTIIIMVRIRIVKTIGFKPQILIKDGQIKNKTRNNCGILREDSFKENKPIKW